jgi:hypothetical protein
MSAIGPICKFCGEPIAPWGPLQQWGHATPASTPFTGPLRFWCAKAGEPTSAAWDGSWERVEPRERADHRV